MASALLLKGQEQDDVTATDSQASICTIAKYMDSPQALQQRNRKVMLKDVMSRPLACARKPEF